MKTPDQDVALEKILRCLDRCRTSGLPKAHSCFLFDLDGFFRTNRAKFLLVAISMAAEVKESQSGS
jgi:hypothetical protein